MKSPEEYKAGAEGLRKIQTKCREWGQVLHENGWYTDKMAAAKTDAAKTVEKAVMILIKEHEAALTYCRSSFFKDSSTALDRAFDYIGIYLGNRGPEALKLTVGLPECLTVEVSQPGVAEPYRETPFVVQLGLWADELDRLAQSSTELSGGGALVNNTATKDDMKRVGEIASLFGVTSGRISQLCNEGKIESVDKGRKRRVSELSANMYFLEKRKRTNNAENRKLAGDARKDIAEIERDARHLDKHGLDT